PLLFIFMIKQLFLYSMKRLYIGLTLRMPYCKQVTSFAGLNSFGKLCQVYAIGTSSGSCKNKPVVKKQAQPFGSSKRNLEWLCVFNVNPLMDRFLFALAS